MPPVPTTFPALVLPHFGRTSRSIWLVVLSCALWLASHVVSIGTARAAAPAERDPEADVPAAMCDPMGASVAVPSDMDLPLVDRGYFEPLPCEALALMLRSEVREAAHGHHAVTGDSERPEQPPREAEPPRNDGARTFVATFPAALEPSNLNAPPNVGLAAHRSHHRAVYRPPLVASRA
jgi:hypothetical protein